MCYFIIACALFIGTAADAFDLTLGWDPNQEDDVAGYRVYYGNQSRNYSHVIDTGDSMRARVKDLMPGKTYYFAVTAYDQDDYESGYSSELQFTVPISPAPLLVLLMDDDTGETENAEDQ